MRYLGFLLLLLPFTLLAQTPISPSTASTDNQLTSETEQRKAVTKPFEPSSVTEKKVFDKKFYALMIGLQASTVLDIESSYYALQNCPRGFTCREGNPVLRPFVSAGRPAVYAFTTATNALAVLSSHKLRKKGSRYWWVPMTVYTGIHAFCAVRNYQTARR